MSEAVAAAATAPDSLMLELAGIERTFRQGREALHVLRGANLEIEAGEVVALVGPSGSGKSTLLHIAGLLEKPDGGNIAIAGRDCTGLDDDGRTLVRRHHLGFVYQYHHLLPEFSALENVVIPQIIAGVKKADARERARELLDFMGLSERLTHRPARLSGGEQQRVAVARALATNPDVLLADEPTGNLDPATADEVFGLLIRLARGAGLAALVATHNPDLAARMDRIVHLEDGVLVEG
jgi:lipoprotein-releasing system ATP-binding protein